MRHKDFELALSSMTGLACLTVAVCMCAVSVFGGINPERVNADGQAILRALYFPLGIMAAGIGVLLLRGIGK